jgi:chitinase
MRKSTLRTLLPVLLGLLWLTPNALAQTISCTGVAAWNPATIYQPGQRLVYQTSLYEAAIQIWNAPPDHCPSCGWYRVVGTCGAPTGGNAAPTANAGADFNLNEGASGALAGSGSDTDGSISSYLWKQTAGPTVTLGAANTARATFTAAQVTADTALSFQLTVTDNQGASASDTVVVTVKNVTTGNAAPLAQAGLDRTVTENTLVNLAGSGTDSDGTIASYRWTQTAGPAAMLNTPNAANANFTAPLVSSNITLTFRLTVTDNQGATGSDDLSITVRDNVPTTVGGKQVGSYFTQWGIYGRNYHVKNIDTSGSAAKLTFINYAFGNVYADGRCGIVTRAESGNGDGGDAYADYQKSYDAASSVDGVGDTWDQPLKGNFNQLKKLKARHPQLKLFISLGGWSWSKNFSRFSTTAAARQTMVASCIDVYLKGNLPVGDGAGGPGAAAGVFDGIDIDWEYPGGGGQTYNTVSPEDKQNFTLLLAEFRRQLDQLEAQTGRNLLLTIAAGAGSDKIDNTEPGRYSQSLDWINLMTYDFHGGFEPQGPAAFQSNYFLDPNNPATGVAHTYAGETAVQKLLAAGVPAQKIVLGIPFYGRGWTGVGSANNGLYQRATGPARGTYEQGIEDYKVLSPRNAPKFYDSTTGQMWTYNGVEFWSFDDARVIATKINVVNTQGLGGLFSWSLDGDDSTGTLVKEIAKVRP